MWTEWMNLIITVIVVPKGKGLNQSEKDIEVRSEWGVEEVAFNRYAKARLLFQRQGPIVLIYKMYYLYVEMYAPGQKTN